MRRDALEDRDRPDVTAFGGSRPRRPRRVHAVQQIPVAKIRPEEGLGRKRDAEGHRELRRSIEQFGVLTPVSVRVARDGSADYLLIKGQGRTLACWMLGIETIPAIVIDDDAADQEKVQQFLVENVARLRMRPIDRALLIARARQDGEETAHIAKRFGVSSATVRRLEVQLDGVSTDEVAALKQGNVNLSRHAVIAKYVGADERSDAVAAVAAYPLKTKDLEALFDALGWYELVKLGQKHRRQRLRLLSWACATFVSLSGGTTADKLQRLAALLPVDFIDKNERAAATP